MATVPPLTDETPLDQYIATASQTDFTFTSMIFATADIKVYVNDVLKVETTDYVVKQANLDPIVPADDLPMDGGKIVFNVGLTLADAVSLSREIPIDRLTGFSTAGAFRAVVLNAELTRMQAINQQLERDIARSVRLSASDSESGSLELPSGRASNYLAFDSSGNLIAAAGTLGTTPITVSSFMETVLDDTTAAAARTTLGAQAADDDLTDIAALTVARGDILVGNSSADWTNLAKGAANTVLVSDGTDPAWSAQPALDATNFTNLSKSSGDVVQVVYTSTGTVATSTTVIPHDNTIPQNTEGLEVLTQAITPTNSSNILYIEVFAMVNANSIGTSIIGAVFQDSTADALAAGLTTVANNYENIISFKHKMTAGTTSSTTFKLRVGPNGATLTINGQGGAQIAGGVLSTSLTITEIKV